MQREIDREFFLKEAISVGIQENICLNFQGFRAWSKITKGTIEISKKVDLEKFGIV